MTVAQDRRVLTKAEATTLASAVYDSLISELEDLTEEEWQAPTACAPWTVGDMVRHLVGAGRCYSSFPRMMRVVAWAQRHRREFDGNDLDAMNHRQVEQHRHLSPAQLLDTLRREKGHYVSKRMSRPRFTNNLPLKTSATGSTPPGTPADLRFGELMRVVLSRDVLVHRLDINLAVGRSEVYRGPHDARLIEDVVLEWFDRHGHPVTLDLGGPAGGVFVQGEGGPELSMTSERFIAILSGRARTPTDSPGAGLFDTRLWF